MIQRTKSVNKRRPGPPRRGQVKDPAYIEWLACEPCLISGEWPATTHHVREFGSPRNDRRTIRLALRYHIEGAGPHSIEKLGKRKFEAFHGINIEVEIARYNQQYEEQRMNATIWGEINGRACDGDEPELAARKTREGSDG